MDQRLKNACGYSEVDLEGRFEFLRSQETNISNLVADILYTEFQDTEIALINSGTLRCNSVWPKGPITLKQISQLLPMVDKVVQLKVPGSILLKALENSVS